MTGIEDLEVRFRWVSLAMVILFGATFAAGLILHVLAPGAPLSRSVLEGGLLILMATPAVRLLITVAERIRRADWAFVVMTLVVVLELLVVMWRASLKG